MRAVRYAVAALAVPGLLTGCTGKDTFPRVASLRTPGPAASPGSSVAPGDQQRPLIAVDATDEERAAAWHAWDRCVLDHGVAEVADKELVLLKKDSLGDPRTEKAVRACRSHRPETAEERQKRTDLAAYKDNQRQWYRCAQRAGYQLNRPDENGEFGLSEIGPQGDFQSEKMQNCRKQAFKD